MTVPAPAVTLPPPEEVTSTTLLARSVPSPPCEEANSTTMSDPAVTSPPRAEVKSTTMLARSVPSPPRKEVKSASTLAVKSVLDRLLATVEKQAASEAREARAIEERKARAMAKARDLRYNQAVKVHVAFVVEHLIHQTERQARFAGGASCSSSASSSAAASSSSAVASSSSPQRRPAATGAYFYVTTTTSAPTTSTVTTSSNGQFEVWTITAIPPTGKAPRLPSSDTRLLDALTADCLEHLLRLLPLPALLLSAAPTCRILANACEPAFAAFAAAQGWRLPRRARGGGGGGRRLDAGATGGDGGALWPWRTLFLAQTCAVCLSPSASFAVRRPGLQRYGAICARLCGPCARRSEVQRHAKSLDMQVDSMSADGGPLFLGLLSPSPLTLTFAHRSSSDLLSMPFLHLLCALLRQAALPGPVHLRPRQAEAGLPRQGGLT